MSSNTFEDSKPNFGSLPTEIILKIFSYLPYIDQAVASMTCSQWFQASEEYFSKVELKISKVCLSDCTNLGQLFIKSNRPYTNLNLFDVYLGVTDDVFQKLGKSLRKISFMGMDFSEKQLCSILNKIEHLIELQFEDVSPLFMSGQFLDSIETQKCFKENLTSLRELSLKKNAYLSDGILIKIMKSIPKLEKLNVSRCPIACHNAIQKRFYPSYFEDTPSESLLTLKYVLKAIQMQASSLKELNLSETLIDGEGLASIAAIENLKLKKVILRSCTQISHRGLDGFTNNQTNIVELDLSNSTSVNDMCVKLFPHLTNIEVIRLKNCRKITDESLTCLQNLKKKKILDLSACIELSSLGIENCLVNERNEILTELYLTSINLGESCVIKCAQNLPNLRVFDLAHCCNGVTDKSLSEIIKNQKWLRNLNLESCHLITDAALTGCELENVDNLVDNSHEQNENNLKNINKISLRSKAEQELVDGVKRTKTILSLLTRNININVGANSEPISALRGLEVLNLSYCNKVSDISLKYGIKFHELRNINISNCELISAIGLNYLTQNCRSIEILDISHLQNLNDEVINYIYNKLKRLKHLHLAGSVLDYSLLPLWRQSRESIQYLKEIEDSE